MSDDLDALGHRLAAEFPVAAQHRGWTVRNLTHSFERMPWGTEETWSCEFVGPRDLWTQRRRYAGGSDFTWRLAADVVGKAESTTPDGLVEQIRAVIEMLGLRDLKEPKVAVETRS